jgi:hypothetical protein
MELDFAGGRYAQAIRLSNGIYYPFYQNLGGVLYRKRRFSEARKCYGIVLEANPSNEIARSRMESMPSTP